MVRSVTTSSLATYWWHSQGFPLCFAVIHMLCSGAESVSCPRHTTTPSSVPALWCQTERRRSGYGVKKEGKKKDEGVKKQAVCDVETSGWKSECQSIWGRREGYNAEVMGGQKKKGGGGGIICVCLSAQWIIRKWTSGFRPPTVTSTASEQYKFSWLKWCHINIIHQYIRYHSKQTITSQIFRSQ